MTSLYVCYQSLLEPLTQTQVVAYLEGLANAEYRIILLTYEPRPLSDAEVHDWRARMSRKGIIWYWLKYHKRPTVPATAFDVGAGILFGLRLCRRHDVGLVHARSHVPGLIGLWLKRLIGTKLLFDVRGLMAEEYVDAGVWPPGGRLFRATKRVERSLLAAADGIVILTFKARDYLSEWYPHEMSGKPVQVIPCCVDLRETPSAAVETTRDHETKGVRLVYVGKLGGWYLTDELVAFVAQATKIFPNLQWQVWTQGDASAVLSKSRAQGLEDRLSIGSSSPEELPARLRGDSAGLAFIKPCMSKLASSATKVAEYLAAGLPVVATAGIGDTDDVLSGAGTFEKHGRVGALVKELNESAYRAAAEELQALLDDPDTPARCRAVAREEFDLEHVGWARYRALYASLLENARAPESASTATTRPSEG